MANARKPNEDQEQVTREDDMLGKAIDEDEFEDVDEVADDEEDEDSEDIDEDM
jgi:hypothetical protein